MAELLQIGVPTWPSYYKSVGIMAEWLQIGGHPWPSGYGHHIQIASPSLQLGAYLIRGVKFCDTRKLCSVLVECLVILSKCKLKPEILFTGAPDLFFHQYKMKSPYNLN